MNVTPEIFTPIHREEVSYGIPTNEEVLRKIAQNLNFLGVLVPVGTIAYVEINHIGVRIPDPGVWQICNGDEITLSTSPLRSTGVIRRYTPNLLNRFPRCALSKILNPIGGTHTYNLNHNHGGWTGNSPEVKIMEDDGKRRYEPSHNHSIAPDLQNATLDFPAGFKSVPYMKIA